MIETMKVIVGWSCLAFSVVGFVETALGFWDTKSYHLGKTLVYCILFGVGLGLIR